MAVIPGTTNPGHLRPNVAAAEVATNLTDAEVARLTGLVDESKGRSSTNRTSPRPTL